MSKLAIIGAGELGKQISNIIFHTNKYELVGFFDDVINVGSVVVDKYIVLGRIADIESYFTAKMFDYLLIAVGYKHMTRRKELFDHFSLSIPFATIIHPSCIIDQTVQIKQGSVIYPGCNIDKNVVIEENVLLNLSVVIAHDTVIGKHSFLAPNTTFSGFVKLGECNFVGTGTIISDNIEIIRNNIIGAGSVVVKNIVKSGIYLGNPAKIKKQILN